MALSTGDKVILGAATLGFAGLAYGMRPESEEEKRAYRAKRSNPSTSVVDGWWGPRNGDDAASQRSNPTRMKVGDTIVLPAGHKVGMGKLREPVTATIVTSHTDEKGETIFKAEWIDAKGKKRSTWFGFSDGCIRNNPSGTYAEGKAAAGRELRDDHWSPDLARKYLAAIEPAPEDAWERGFNDVVRALAKRSNPTLTALQRAEMAKREAAQDAHDTRVAILKKQANGPSPIPVLLVIGTGMAVAFGVRRT